MEKMDPQISLLFDMRIITVHQKQIRIRIFAPKLLLFLPNLAPKMLSLLGFTDYRIPEMKKGKSIFKRFEKFSKKEN